jgi:hypothetical protein
MEPTTTTIVISADEAEEELRHCDVNGVRIWRECPPDSRAFIQVGNPETVEKSTNLFCQAYDRCLKTASRLARRRGADYVLMTTRQSSFKGAGEWSPFFSIKDATWLRVELTFYTEQGSANSHP